MVKPFVYASLMSAALLALLLGGCGSDKKKGEADPTASAVRIDNSNCTSACHAGTVSSVASALTGASIPTDWAASRHATTGAADCQDCHGGGSLHWGLGPIPIPDPDASLTCTAVCHANMPPPHTNSITAGANYPASFINSQNIGQCGICHNPHNPTTLMPINVQWASTGKGDVNAAPWANREFKTSGHNGNPAVSTASDCVRCHTTTGFINYISSNFANVRAWGVATDKTKETLQCNACHDQTYNFASQRSLGAATAYYNYSSRNTKKLLVNRVYPDIGKSNLCVICHVGRENGETLAAVAALPASGVQFVNYTSQAFINSHYLTGGATVFGVSAYAFPTQAYAGPSTHAGAEAPAAGTQGPCVSCHMQRTVDIAGVTTGLQPSHLFRPEFIPAGFCAGCHSVVEPNDTAEVAAFQAGYDSALLALKVILKENSFRQMFWQSRNPYFFTSASATAPSLVKWHSLVSPVIDVNESGQRNLGAAFNYNLFAHDPGGFAHNATYVKQVVFDSIDWLDDNVLPLNGSVVAAINALTYADEINPATGGVFTAGEIAAQKAAAIAYLNGGARP